MSLTASFIRSLSGLNEAELPDSVVTELQLSELADQWFSDLPSDITGDMPENIALYYKGYKAITLLELYILTAVPEKIKDNFNEITRFDSIKAMLDLAKEKVAELESPASAELSRFEVVPPNLDPVTQEVR